MRLGWRTPRVDSLKLAELAYTRTENTHKVCKKTFVFNYVAVICTTTGRTEQIRVCVTRYDQSAQNRRQKVFTRGATGGIGKLSPSEIKLQVPELKYEAL